MKKIFTLILCATFVYNANAGKSIESGLIIGTASQVHQSIHNNPNQLNINGEILKTTVLNQNNASVSGTIKGYEGSQFAINTNEKNELSGFILLSKTNDIAYKYITNANNDVELKKVSVSEILCVNYVSDQNNSAKNIKQKVKQTSVLGGGAVPIYNSLSSSDKILFLDFDGFNLPSGSGWNNGTAMSASSANYSDTEIFQTWSIIAEDYSAFNVNVTTDSTLYENAPLNKKIRMVFTNTSSWYANAGGVAYVDVFDFADVRYKTGWVFVDRMYGAHNAGEAGAHEAGHTFGLNHDGTVAHDAVQAAGYYSGHSVWAPIMGSAYGQEISQFSKGEYNYADNTSQDDLAVIASVVGYKSDDHGDTYLSATDLSLTLNGNTGTIDSIENIGLIHNRTDLDFYHFNTNGGVVDLKIAPTSTIKANLDIEMKIYDQNYTLIGTFNTNHDAYTMKGIIYNTYLAAGEYYFSVDGTGTGDATTGWNDYSSIGQFYISGTIDNTSFTTNSVTLNSDYQLAVYPNPLNNSNYINFNTMVDNAKLLDSTGKLIAQDSNCNKLQVNNDLSSGVYFLQVISGNETNSIKIIK
jgi:hypothetical protein